MTTSMSMSMSMNQSTKQTYKQTILNHLLTGATLTNMQAYAQYGMTCFLQRVSELRAAGIPIRDKSVKNNGKHYNVYWLDSDYIQNHKAYEVTP